MRLFIAIEIPEHISLELRKIQESIKQEGIKLVKDFHLTLKFLGEIEEKDVEKIKSDLQKIQFEPFEATLNGAGVFPNMHHINTIWIGLEPEIKFEEIAKQIDPDEKRFKAHITLGRVKFMKNKQAFIEKFNKIEVPKISFKVDKIKLIKSTLTREGPVYEVLAEFPNIQNAT